jgi:hypothetical protein
MYKPGKLEPAGTSTRAPMRNARGSTDARNPPSVKRRRVMTKSSDPGTSVSRKACVLNLDAHSKRGRYTVKENERQIAHKVKKCDM